MYEEWHLRKRETPMSDAKHLFTDSLTDKDGLLQIEVGDYMNNKPISRYKITFQNYPAYRNILEEYRLNLWKRRADAVNSDAKGWTLFVDDSPWIREFDHEPLLAVLNAESQHYLISTENDVIEVLSNRPPTIETLL